MKDRHLRLPRRSRGGGLVSWARVPASHYAGTGSRFVEYRLFRRDFAGAWHYQCEQFTEDMPRAEMAARVRAMKHQLRDRVDELDLARMEEPA